MRGDVEIQKRARPQNSPAQPAGEAHPQAAFIIEHIHVAFQAARVQFSVAHNRPNRRSLGSGSITLQSGKPVREDAPALEHDRVAERVFPSWHELKTLRIIRRAWTGWTNQSAPRFSVELFGDRKAERII